MNPQIIDRKVVKQTNIVFVLKLHIQKRLNQLVVQLTTKQDLKQYWNARAKKLGRIQQGLQVVVFAGASEQDNIYSHFLQEQALLEALPLKRRAKILDLGCGWGRWSFELASEGSLEIVGIDISKEMIRIAVSKKKYVNLDNVHFLVSTTDSLPFKNSYFDEVVSVECLQHVVNQNDFIESVEEIQRVCREAGYAVILEKTSSKRRFGPFGPRWRSQKEWVDAFEANGFSLIFQKGVNVAPFRK